MITQEQAAQLKTQLIDDEELLTVHMGVTLCMVLTSGCFAYLNTVLKDTPQEAALANVAVFSCLGLVILTLRSSKEQVDLVRRINEAKKILRY